MAEAAPLPGRQLLVARIGDTLVGLPTDGIARILPMLPLWRPPTLPQPVAGFVATGGGTLAVLDGHVLFGLGERRAPSLYAHIVTLQAIAGQRAGLLVDRAEGFATPMALGEIDPGKSLNGCAVALFQYEGKALAHLVAPERLLGEAEQAVLAALTDEAERRRAEWQVAA